MLDSRRDCRYRGGAHRNIGVGLGKVSFHNMPGTQEEVPGFPLTLIQPSAWNGHSTRMQLPAPFMALFTIRSRLLQPAAWLPDPTLPHLRFRHEPH